MNSAAAVAPPPPRVTIEGEPFIPYIAPEDFNPRLKSILEPYEKRMGFVPNAVKLYAHRPEIAETLWLLNSRIMRDASSTLDQLLKRKLAAVACSINGCAYCTAHSCAMLKKPSGLAAEGWELDEAELQTILQPGYVPDDPMEAVCFEYVSAASFDPTSVPDALLDRLRERLSAAQIIELAALVGFWKFYNTVHDSLHIPVESHLLVDTGYIRR